ncbi:PLP-dependent aminotransferase family protein [Propionibacterium freudenreichii]|uniref:MocR-like pyridoxine biosynthesis transcription factor PdxR n=1 Tax=Propionibacterium freudenreichii TaxID=1744 RepID=UPI0005A5C7E8|nr:PLP-dependent aminotransferase family protein [Propionibacterium freudenreichii]MDK9332076.1 PLP-dependent aminotransferase family protein [Propionibacterium freudenreichii]CEI49466.1 Transcriptional regulator [Propionibacterium freudenreichii]SBT28943.1 HTH-type pyridoxine biosynthesis transcriptional regulator pdxR [Propionibacterium freudenreichii]
MRGQLVVDLPLHLDTSGDLGLTAQLVVGLRGLIDQGRLHHDDELPSTRALAASLSVARGTVVAAYDQLQAEGYLTSRPGSGTRVAAVDARRPVAGPSAPAPPAPQPDGRAIDLRPGTPDVSAIVSPPWRRAWREATNDPRPLIDARGLPSLRHEIAEHLRLMRSLVRPSDQVLVTSGAREGLALLLAALARRGERPPLVGLERPGHPALAAIPTAMGLPTIALRTDDRGLVTEELPEAGSPTSHGPDVPTPDVIVVTPSHQYPYGGSLSITRRQQLLGWAARTGAIVVEDDYDSELRYVGMPLPALATLDDPVRGRVVLLGTFSTVLTPAVATGYLSVPQRLAPLVAGHRAIFGSPVPALGQQALSNYLASGELRRHIQRMRREYRRRRELIVAAFRDAPHARLTDMSGGLQAVLRTNVPGSRITRRLAARGVLVSDLAQFWGPHAPAMDGIVFGFGSVDTPTLRHVLPIIRRACS